MPSDAPPVFGGLLPKAAAPCVSVASWNCLNQHWATRASLPHAAEPHLAWAARWPRLKRELAALGADVVCVQEVTPEAWDDLAAAMAAAGYAGARTERHRQDVVLAAFWRRAALSLAWLEERSRALLLQFEPSSGVNDSGARPAPLYVVNLHAQARPECGADRVAQVRSALRRLALHIGRVEAAAGGAPDAAAAAAAVAGARVVVCGDLNSAADGGSVAELLLAGALPAGHVDPATRLPDSPPDGPVEVPFPGFVDCYAEAGRAGDWTHHAAPGAAPGARLDAVFRSRALRTAAVLPSLAALRAAAGPGGELVLPNALCPSDHLPVGAVLELGGGE